MLSFKMNEPLIVECPHCQGTVMIDPKELNCRIFRHAAYKLTGLPISPHASLEKCTRLIQEEAIYGCGKPFRIDHDNHAVVCDYI